MFEPLKSLFTKHAAPAPEVAAGAPARPVQVAACALLLEMAYADDDFSPAERRSIEEVVRRQFDLDADGARALMELAEAARRESIDLHQFTALIREHYDEGQRMVLAELLWRVVYADGTLSRFEDALMQKLSHLLDLHPGYLAEAKRRATGE